MPWIFLILMAFFSYVAVGVTVAKYERYRRILDYEDPEPSGYVFLNGLCWPLALTEGIGARGLLYPSLWLWSRFREEWPQRQAEVKRDHQRAVELKKKKHYRNREVEIVVATNEDLRADISHDKQMDQLRRETETLQEARYDKLKALPRTTVRSEEGEIQVYCEVHTHWVSQDPEDRWDSCR